jgi:hypothetical protein
MGTQTQTDYPGDTKTSNDKPVRSGVVAVWVYLFIVLLFIGFFGLSLRETGGRLAITTILYFLGAATMTVALFRLAIGRLFSIINVSVGGHERTENRSKV